MSYATREEAEEQAERHNPDPTRWDVSVRELSSSLIGLRSDFVCSWMSKRVWEGQSWHLDLNFDGDAPFWTLFHRNRYFTGSTYEGALGVGVDFCVQLQGFFEDMRGGPATVNPIPLWETLDR